MLDRDLSEDVGRYLNLVGSSRARDLRRLVISTSGSGERDLFVSYISELPVWKSTYRILMPTKPGAKPLLQGWAVVDNTVGQTATVSPMMLIPARAMEFSCADNGPAQAGKHSAVLGDIRAIRYRRH